jgi:predicted nucleotidyltransferase
LLASVCKQKVAPEIGCINFLIKYKFDDAEMKNLSFSKIEQKLKKYFAGKDYIAFAYLFGSMARGKFTPLSDIDIAVYIDQTKTAEDLFRLKL